MHRSKESPGRGHNASSESGWRGDCGDAKAHPHSHPGHPGLNPLVERREGERRRGEQRLGGRRGGSGGGRLGQEVTAE